MKNLAPALPLLASFVFVAGCNTPPKDPPRDGADLVPASPPATAAVTAVPTAAAPAAPSAATTAVTTAVTTATAIPSASATGSAKPVTSGKPAPCASDADCRTFSSYCQEAPCACRVLAKTDGDPKCLGSGPKVNCLVDPCMKKAARCQSGACVLTAQGAGATEK